MHKTTSIVNVVHFEQLIPEEITDRQDMQACFDYLENNTFFAQRKDVAFMCVCASDYKQMISDMIEEIKEDESLTEEGMKFIGKWELLADTLEEDQLVNLSQDGG